MLSIAAELETIINRHLPALKAISEIEYSRKPSPKKWSKKEILGHLIDSAENNIRRFIVAQYEDTPHIVYQQDFWVTASDYQKWKITDIIDLWFLANKKIGHVLNNMPQEMHGRKCRTQDLHDITWLAKDYIKHLEHHLHQVLDQEPVAYP